MSAVASAALQTPAGGAGVEAQSPARALSHPPVARLPATLDDREIPRPEGDLRTGRQAVFKLIGYWSAPSDPEDIQAFEDAYLNHHCPTAAKIPGLRRLITVRVEEGLEGSQAGNYRIAELLFDDRDAYEAASRTPEFAAMRADGGSLCEQFGVTVVGETGVEVDHQLGG